MTQQRASLTFAAFQATGKDVADIREVHEDFSDRDIYPDPVPARVYAEHGQLYLEPNRSPDPSVLARGPWVCEIGNWCAIGELSEVEAALYDFYLSECVDPDLRPYLTDVTPPTSFRAVEPDTENSLAELLMSYCEFHNVQPCSARMLLEGTSDPKQQRWLTRFILRWASTVEGDADARLLLAKLDAPRGATHDES